MKTDWPVIFIPLDKNRRPRRRRREPKPKRRESAYGCPVDIVQTTEFMEKAKWKPDAR